MSKYNHNLADLLAAGYTDTGIRSTEPSQALTYKTAIDLDYEISSVGMYRTGEDEKGEMWAVMLYPNPVKGYKSLPMLP